MSAHNPYGWPAGPELDRQIHSRLFDNREAKAAPFYSKDEKFVRRIARQLESRYGREVVTGHLNVHPRKFFARFESGASTATEVVAETLPLAICRLAVLVTSNYDPAGD